MSPDVCRANLRQANMPDLAFVPQCLMQQQQHTYMALLLL